MPISPLAPSSFPSLPFVQGVGIVTALTGVKYQNRSDLLLVTFDPGTTVAGVFTQSATASAAVLDCRASLEQSLGQGRALLVNAGNANAFTGKAGAQTVQTLKSEISALSYKKGVQILPEQILTASTGVIGEWLDPQKITPFLPACFEHLSKGEDQGLEQREAQAAQQWKAAAQAIMTTDTFPKGAVETVCLEGQEIKLVGFCKGSGMIAPDMATMLAFLFTDAPVEAALLQKLLAKAAQRSFNSVTVDGDTSTSDSLFCAATGAVSIEPLKGCEEESERVTLFYEALERLAISLAKQVARDGEGAQKFITVKVEGAVSESSARKVALAVANSPLVKTAVAGEDPNWGRLVMAVGKSGEPVDRDQLDIFIGPVQVTSEGQVVSGYQEEPVALYMKGQEIEFRLSLGLGDGQAKVWSCDLTQGYIQINADYRS